MNVVFDFQYQRCSAWHSARKLAAVSLGCIFLLSGAPSSLAQRVADERTEAQKRLEQNKSDLDRTNKRVGAIRTDVDTLIAERAQMNARLSETGKLVQDTESRMTALEKRLTELGGRRDGLRKKLTSQNTSIAKLLAAMQRMGRDPPPVIITQRSDALKMVRSAMLLARAFPELKGQADLITAQLTALVRVMAQHKAESARLRNESIRLNDARTQLAALIETKRQSLEERKRELEELRRTAGLISRNVASLSEMISKLDKAVSQNTELGNYNATVQPENPRVAMVAPPPTVQIAPGAGTRSANAGRLTPAVPFYQAKATLPLPARGDSVINFGDKTQYGGQSKGLVIKTRFSAQITSPSDGWVVYAGEFRSYGQLLIINAGAGYHILLAGLSRIDVQLGQFVLASEPIGSMPAAPRSGAQDNAPVLYVEFRKNGKPIDPSPWWAKGQQKVQG
ncbi:MAG TPA: peptidoglycan DD-metalloendopeptidase family protein [Hyphomicrobiaceae bacterium]|nr:peptidoglycan DD-metalloendopeptidase family protein [Hyphomicrobiaceae bacterium]